MKSQQTMSSVRVNIQNMKNYLKNHFLKKAIKNGQRIWIHNMIDKWPTSIWKDAQHW